MQQYWLPGTYNSNTKSSLTDYFAKFVVIQGAQFNPSDVV